MVLRRIARKLQEFRRRLRCRAIVCIDNYELLCKLGSVQELARCLADVDRVAMHGLIDPDKAEELRKLCAEIAWGAERKCIEMHKECCG